MNENNNIEKIIEALLFSSEKPVPFEKIAETLEGVDINDIKNGIAKLSEYYNSGNRSFYIVEVAGGYQIVTKPEYSIWINKLYKKPQDKLRGASLETLSIIVYKQPITKLEIEAIRGVNVDSVLKTLIEKNLIKIKGRKDSPGRPLLYGTTEEFLEHFGLKDLNSLPPLKEFCESDLDYEKYKDRLEGLDRKNELTKEVQDEPKKSQA